MVTRGKAIAGRRKQLGLSVKQLAARCGVEWQAIQQLEAGTVANPGYVLRLLKALKWTEADWSKWDQSPTSKEARDLLTSNDDQGQDTTAVEGESMDQYDKSILRALVNKHTARKVINETLDIDAPAGGDQTSSPPSEGRQS